MVNGVFELFNALHCRYWIRWTIVQQSKASDLYASLSCFYDINVSSTVDFSARTLSLERMKLRRQRTSKLKFRTFQQCNNKVLR